MNTDCLLVLVSSDPTELESLRRELLDSGSPYSLQRASGVATALARIGGGGVRAVLLALPPMRDAEPPHDLVQLRQAAPQVPVVVLCDTSDQGVAAAIQRAGAAACVPRACHQADLIQALRAATSQNSLPEAENAEQDTDGGAVVSVLGVKGGVGATTLALNLACAFSQRQRVILAEFRPMLGSLGYYLRPSRRVRNLSNLLNLEAEPLPRSAVDSCLWTSPTVPGLQVLYGPQSPGDCREISSGRASAIMKALAANADYVVVDMPASLSDANRQILAASDYLALAVEREPVCLESAKFVLRALQLWDVAPGLVGTVVVNRAPLVAPLSVSEIEAELGLPTLAVIPPAPDLCLQSQKARTPLIQFDPESLAAGALLDLASRFAPKRRLRHSGATQAVR